MLDTIIVDLSVANLVFISDDNIVNKIGNNKIVEAKFHTNTIGFKSKNWFNSNYL